MSQCIQVPCVLVCTQDCHWATYLKDHRPRRLFAAQCRVDITAYCRLIWHIATITEQYELAPNSDFAGLHFDRKSFSCLGQHDPAAKGEFSKQ